MKNLTKNKVAKSLAAIVNVSFYVLIILTILLIPTLFGPKMFFVVRLKQLIIFIMGVFILWQIRAICKAFRDSNFFTQRIVITLRRLSVFFILLAIVKYVFILSLNLDSASSDFMLTDFIFCYIKPINFSLLFLSAISYLLSFVAKEGYELKEENILTV